MTQRSRDDERADRDAGLDETLAATFPASDPLSTDPNPSHSDERVRNAEQDKRNERRGLGREDVEKPSEKPGPR